MLFAHPADAQEWRRLNGDPAYRSPFVTHLESPLVTPYVEQAFRLWSTGSALRDGGPGQDIVITLDATFADGEANAYYCLPGDADCADPGAITRCDIRLSPHWPDFNEAYKGYLLAHEMGHCFGFDHNAAPSILGVGSDFTAVDSFGAGFVYPLSHTPGRVFATYVVYDW